MNRFVPLVVTAALAICVAGGLAPRASRAAAPTAGATLKGTVKIQGAVPKGTRIDMSADPKCANSGAVTEDVVSDGKGGLGNVIVYVSQGLGDAKFDPPHDPIVIEQKGCTYVPHVLAARATQEIKVVNADSTTHNIHPQPNNNRELNQSQPPGVPFSMTFAREEIAIPVKCNIHPWMRGSIAVFKHPFFSVTQKDGSFEITGLPAGSYTVTAWHEKFGTSFQKIAVGESETKTLDFVFKSGS